MINKYSVVLGLCRQKYINRCVWELSQENLPKLIELRFGTIADATNSLGEISLIKDVYNGFQQSLYQNELAS